jgi:hypothetical protein
MATPAKASASSKAWNASRELVTVDNDVAFGPVWKFFFPNGDTRCEVRGSKGYEIQQNTDIYVGWRVKYNVALGTLRYVFQMKGYPPPALQANHPVVFGTEKNNLVLINYDLQDQRHTIWQSPITRDQWLTVVLHMYMSKAIHGPTCARRGTCGALRRRCWGFRGRR